MQAHCSKSSKPKEKSVVKKRLFDPVGDNDCESTSDEMNFNDKNDLLAKQKRLL